MSQHSTRPSRRHRLPSYERLTPSNSNTGLNGEVHKHTSSSTSGSGLSVPATSTSRTKSRSGSGSALKPKMTPNSSSNKKREARFAKTWLVEGFKAFGRHIARNQVSQAVLSNLSALFPAVLRSFSYHTAYNHLILHTEIFDHIKARSS